MSLGPRAVERPADAGFTIVGGLDSLRPARVDGAGAVQLDDADWSLDWWVGAEDRWYLPSREAAVRQRRIGGGPVLETAMRVPGGDVLLRTWAVNLQGADGTTDGLVVEFENTSSTPVAMAFALRPYGLDGTPGGPFRLEVTDDRVRFEGTTMIRLPKRPNEIGTSHGDVVDRLVAGRALTDEVGDDDALLGVRSAAFVYPVPHQTSVRIVLGAELALVDGPDGVRRVAPHDRVANGWDQVIARGGRFVLPDNGLTQQVEAAQARLAQAGTTLPRRVAALEPGAGRILEGLASGGAIGEVLGSLGAFAGSFPTKLPKGTSPGDASAIVSGVGRAARLADDPAMAEELLEPAAQLTLLVEKAAAKARRPEIASEALIGLGRLLLVTGRADTAANLFRRGAGLVRDDLPSTLGGLSTMAEAASPARSWGDDDPNTAARFWLGMRELLIQDWPDRVDVFPQFPAAWRGGGVEVHGAVTTHGMLSFAIRWHGARPALLWDLEPFEHHVPHEVTLRCPGLDPTWSTTEARGETLLAGVSDDLPSAPSEGDSFV